MLGSAFVAERVQVHFASRIYWFIIWINLLLF